MIFSKMRSFYPKLVNSLLAIALTVFAATWIARYAGQTIGWYLRRKTSGRRSLILSRVKLEEEAYTSRDRKSAKSDDEDWEKVESYAAGSAENGAKAEDDWAGVVGFFHPFW